MFDGIAITPKVQNAFDRAFIMLQEELGENWNNQTDVPAMLTYIHRRSQHDVDFAKQASGFALTVMKRKGPYDDGRDMLSEVAFRIAMYMIQGHPQ